MGKGAQINSAMYIELQLTNDIRKTLKTRLFKNTAYILVAPKSEWYTFMFTSACYLFNLPVKVEYQMNIPGQTQNTYSFFSKIFESKFKRNSSYQSYYSFNLLALESRSVATASTQTLDDFSQQCGII